jgi:hypothetical protein
MADHAHPAPDTLKGDLKKGAAVSHSAGGKIPYVSAIGRGDPEE